MADIPIGARHEEKILVTGEVAIDFLGLEDARVLSTPHLIGWMERTARNLLLKYLEKGYDTVGTEVHVKHLAAAPIGMSVTFRAEVIAVDGRRVNFRVEAEDETEKIGEGTHERTIINVARFASKLAAKNAQP
jgi:fluoroacetyl-CoA thioesterase